LFVPRARPAPREPPRAIEERIGRTREPKIRAEMALEEGSIPCGERKVTLSRELPSVMCAHEASFLDRRQA
jgi:hypothetical protein